MIAVGAGLIVTAACGEHAVVLDGGGIDASAVDFVGTVAVTYHQGSSSLDVPVDLSKIPVRAWQETDVGEYQSFEGTGRTDGSFQISGVASARLLVQVGDQYFSTDSSSLDAGWDEIGYPGRAIASAATRISISVTGLQSWQDGDHLDFYVPQSGELAAGLESYALNRPIPGDEQITDMTFDWEGNRLISTSEGDLPTLVQTSVVFDSAEATVWVPVRRLDILSLDQLDAQTSTLTGVFSVVPDMESTILDWRGSAIHALAADIHPTAVADFLGIFSIIVLPPAAVPWTVAGNEQLLQTRVWTAEADLNFGAFAHPAAVESGDPVGMYTSFAFFTTHQLPGSLPTEAIWYWRHITDLPSAESAGIGPLVSPPRSLRVNDLPADSDLAGVTTTPVLSWSTPRVGTASQYAVTVVEVFDNVGRTWLNGVAHLYLSDTSVRLPPGILTPGRTYLFVVEARYCPDVDLQHHPHRFAMPYEAVPAITELVTP